MACKTIYIGICILFFHGSVVFAHKDKDSSQPGCLDKAGRFLSGVVVDIIDLHVNLFSVDSAKILTAFTPLYISSRFIDEDLQSCFYDPSCHKNVNQLPKSCHEIAKSGVGIPMVALSSMWFFGWNEDIRYTGRMTLLGLPFVHSGKDIIQDIDTKCCWRPWNEHFSCEKRSPGGFPSGHMANLSYLTTLWGLRHGYKWALPIGLFSVFLFADFLSCNRHYFSQLIAGAGWGAIYGFAASKVVDKRLSDRLTLSVCSNPRGGAAIQVACSF